jgi:hypothetical protein
MMATQKTKGLCDVEEKTILRGVQKLAVMMARTVL